MLSVVTEMSRAQLSGAIRSPYAAWSSLSRHMAPCVMCLMSQQQMRAPGEITIIIPTFVTRLITGGEWRNLQNSFFHFVIVCVIAEWNEILC